MEIDLVHWHLQMPTLSGEITVMELLQKRNHDMNIDVLCGNENRSILPLFCR